MSVRTTQVEYVVGGSQRNTQHLDRGTCEKRTELGIWLGSVYCCTHRTWQNSLGHLFKSEGVGGERQKRSGSLLLRKRVEGDEGM